MFFLVRGWLIVAIVTFGFRWRSRRVVLSLFLLSLGTDARRTLLLSATPH